MSLIEKILNLFYRNNDIITSDIFHKMIRKIYRQENRTIGFEKRIAYNILKMTTNLFMTEFIEKVDIDNIAKQLKILHRRFPEEFSDLIERSSSPIITSREKRLTRDVDYYADTDSDDDIDRRKKSRIKTPHNSPEQIKSTDDSEKFTTPPRRKEIVIPTAPRRKGVLDFYLESQREKYNNLYPNLSYERITEKMEKDFRDKIVPKSIDEEFSDMKI